MSTDDYAPERLEAILTELRAITSPPVVTRIVVSAGDSDILTAALAGAVGLESAAVPLIVHDKPYCYGHAVVMAKCTLCSERWCHRCYGRGEYVLGAVRVRAR